MHQVLEHCKFYTSLFIHKAQMKEKLTMFFDLNHLLAAGDSALRGKGLRVTLSTSYVPNRFSHTAILCSVNAARRGH